MPESGETFASPQYSAFNKLLLLLLRLLLLVFVLLWLVVSAFSFLAAFFLGLPLFLLTGSFFAASLLSAATELGCSEVCELLMTAFGDVLFNSCCCCTNCCNKVLAYVAGCDSVSLELSVTLCIAALTSWVGSSMSEPEASPTSLQVLSGLDSYSKPPKASQSCWSGRIAARSSCLISWRLQEASMALLASESEASLSELDTWGDDTLDKGSEAV